MLIFLAGRAQAQDYRGLTDLEWLARMAVLEQGQPSDEWGAFMQVAINRVRSSRYPNRVGEVIYALNWSGSSEYQERLEAPRGVGWESSRGRAAAADHGHYREALIYAHEFLSDLHPNLIGDRTHFFHPRSCEGLGLAPGEWSYRTRGGEPERAFLCRDDGLAWPVWAVPVSLGGTAAREPVRVGSAWFS